MSVFENFVENDSITVYCTFKGPKRSAAGGSGSKDDAESAQSVSTVNKGNSPIPSF